MRQVYDATDGYLFYVREDYDDDLMIHSSQRIFGHYCMILYQHIIILCAYSLEVP